MQEIIEIWKENYFTNIDWFSKIVMNLIERRKKKKNQLSRLVDD